MRLFRCFPVALWVAIAGASLSLTVAAGAEVTEGVLQMTQVT
jgi:hypothetical protein